MLSLDVQHSKICRMFYTNDKLLDIRFVTYCLTREGRRRLRPPPDLYINISILDGIIVGTIDGNFEGVLDGFRDGILVGN